MQFLVIPNRLKKEAVDFAVTVKEKIKESGNLFLEYTDINRRICDENERAKISQCDMTIVIGGDGTVLRAVRLLYGFNLPVWCINFGHIGYLADCQPEDFSQKFEKVLSNQMITENRITLECEIVGQKENLVAFNEVVIHRAAISRALKIDFSLNENFISKIRADGVIVSTPTGSTAYNISAGGPVLSPTSTDMVVTSVCPVPDSFTHIVVNGDGKIEFIVHLPSMEGDDKDDTPLLVLDGLKKYHLTENSAVRVKRGSEVFRLIKTTM